MDRICRNAVCCRHINTLSEWVRVVMNEFSEYRNGTLESRAYTDRKYFIIRCPREALYKSGFCGKLMETFAAIEPALKEGYIPVIDWNSVSFPGYGTEEGKSFNVWEKFFEQPCGISPEEAYALNDCFEIDKLSEFPNYSVIDYEKLADAGDPETVRICELYKKYVRLRKDLAADFETQKKKLFGRRKKVIGILCRGTDYTCLKPPFHSIVPAAENMISETEELIKKYAPDGIFLVTEDRRIFAKFMRKFGKLVITADADRFGDTGNQILNQLNEKNDQYNKDLNYLMQIYILSKLDCQLISPGTGGAVAAMMGNASEYYHFYHTGRYSYKTFIWGSGYEDQMNKNIMLNGLPMIYYSLTMAGLFSSRDIMIASDSSAHNNRLQELLGDGSRFGMRINYCIKNKNRLFTLRDQMEWLDGDRLLTLNEDEFCFGNGFDSMIYRRLKRFDGAYCFEATRADNSSHVMKRLGISAYDLDVSGIIKKTCEKNENASMIDVDDVYRSEHKFFTDRFRRGIVCSEFDNKDKCDSFSLFAKYIENTNGLKIGDFAASFQKKDF